MTDKHGIWWRAPLQRWLIEVDDALLDRMITLPFNMERQQLAAAMVALQKLGPPPAGETKPWKIEPLVRQLVGHTGPKVLPVKTRKKNRAPRERALLGPLLGPLAIDAGLRPQRRPGRVELETFKKIADAIPTMQQKEKERRAVITKLSAEQRANLCAVGYLLLVAVLAVEAAKLQPTAPETKRIRNYSPISGNKRSSDPARQRARMAIIEVLNAALWLYGQPLYKPAAKLVDLITEETFTASSVRWLYLHNPQFNSATKSPPSMPAAATMAVA
jgi:hypothetical protein